MFTHVLPHTLIYRIQMCTLLSSIEAHCRMKTLQRGVGQVSSRFQTCSRTADLCRGKEEMSKRRKRAS